jgi:hypothetical protein
MTAEDVDLITDRVTEDIGDIAGYDGCDYYLETGDVTELPKINAEPLLENDAVVLIEDSQSSKPRYSRPVEPIVIDVDVELVRPVDDGRDIRTVHLGTCRCKRCGSTTESGVVNGALQDPHQCSACDR